MNAVRIIAVIIVFALGIYDCSGAELVPKSEYVYQSLALVDMLTTLDVKNHPEAHEDNPLLGQHPSDTKVLAYFAAEGIIHAVISYELNKRSPKAARIWEYVSIGVEAGCVVNNIHVGMRLKF